MAGATDAPGQPTRRAGPRQLATNNGAHHLHGGRRGFDRHLWRPTVDECASRVLFSRISPAGEEHYPGWLSATVSYTFTDAHELRIEYHALCDAPTPVNLTNHTYFNLCGHIRGGTVVRAPLRGKRPIGRQRVPTRRSSGTW